MRVRAGYRCFHGVTGSLAVSLAALASLGAGAGCSPPPPVVRPAPIVADPSPARPVERPELETRRWLLQRDAALAIAEGAGELRVLAADVGSEGDRVGAFLEMPRGECMVAFARGSDGVDDLDMMAFADDGTPIGADEASDPHPALLLCPPLPARAYVVARIAAGRGLVALGMQSVPLEAAVRVGKALNARGRPAEGAREAEVWPGLDAKAEAQRREAGGRWEETRRVAVPVDARSPSRVTAPLEAGRCLALLVTPSDETSEVDVQVLDGDGRVIGRAGEAGRERSAVVCTALATQITVEVRARIASGVAAVVMARSVAGSEADVGARVDRIDAFPAGDLASAKKRSGERLAQAGYGAPSASASGAAQAGRRASVEVAVPKGCARLDVVGGAPLAGLSVDAWSAQGALLARGEGGSGVALFACGEGGKARVDVEATGRPGPFSVEVRAEPKADARLLQAGLAGGRLLARFNAGGEAVRAESLGSLSVIPLDATSVKQVDLRVPERRCLEVAAAVGAKGSGVDLRLVDGATRDEIALSRASSSASARACAGAAARPIAVELRLGAGSADVLLGARLVEPAR